MRSPSFSDHFSQATLFWNSMADWEKKHIVDALSFELNMLSVKAIQDRVVNDLLANVADELAERVAKNIGLPLKASPISKSKKKPIKPSPALSMNKQASAIKGRKVAILVGDGVDGRQVADLKAALAADGALTDVIARFAGVVQTAAGKTLPVDKPAPNAPSVLYDAVIVPGGEGSAAALSQSGLAVHFINEAYLHCKTIGAIGEGVDLLRKAQINLPENIGDINPGIGLVVMPGGRNTGDFSKAFIAAMKQHRHYQREIDSVPG